MAEAISQRDWETLNIVAGRAARVRSFVGDRIRSKTAFPSLLSVFAELYFQDIEEGGLLRVCANCRELYMTGRKWSKYCTPQCAAKKRQQRFLQRNPDYYKATGRSAEHDETKNGKT
jgi:hypothetical protein